MIVLIVIAIVLCAVFYVLSRSSNNNSAPSEAQKPNDYAYGMAWPKPNKDDLWDSLDYFVRLAEIQSGQVNFDLTVVNLVLYVEDKYNHKKGDFKISYFDFEWAQGRFANEIPYLKDVLKNFDGHSFEGSDPETTALIYSPEKIHEIVTHEAPHAQLGNVFRGSADGTLCIGFSFPARG